MRRSTVPAIRKSALPTVQWIAICGSATPTLTATATAILTPIPTATATDQYTTAPA